MIDRYTRKVMRDIWSEEAKFQAWLDVEILIDEAWSELGEIPKEDVEKIKANAKFDVARILEIEQEKLDRRMENADIILSKKGEVLRP